MKRRNFVGGMAVLCVAASTARAKSLSGDIDENYDIVVIGGGVAGTVAALQAARGGAKTLLVESGSQLGGTMTTAGVNIPGLFHAWGKQVIAGIGWELVRDCVEMNSGELPNFSDWKKLPHWKTQVEVNEYLYPCLAEEKLLAAGVHILYYFEPTAVAETDSGCVVSLGGKSETKKVSASRVIDCTGNAAAVALAGFARVRGKVVQPGTLVFKLGNYDFEKLDVKTIKKNFDAAIGDGELSRECWWGSIGGILKMGGGNVQHIADADSSDSSLQTAANIRGRESLMRLYRFLKRQKGLEKIRLTDVKTEAGIRETYRIDALHNITVEEYCSGKVYPDSLCYTFYPIDMHGKDGVKPRMLKDGVVPTIPLSALLPKGSKYVVAAGRHIGSDRLANSALRVQASCMAMGQAAAAAAVVSIRRKTPISGADIAEVRKVLADNGAIVPPAV